ncbi:DUF6795 domain-containing protein [Vibrio penaeicida]|uniref:DUF6795 domain-containing protein n=1 Tax=Vibrio penaeicida TaxID=104609 RepID=UPI000CE9B799|nr:DUF6795 domain-containing protein [Vibrio penaeicida]
MAKFLLKGLLLVLTTLPILAIAESVDLFKKRVVHLCPEINGRLMDGDKPLSGITIERGVAYGELYEDEVITDEDGYFSFPLHEYETRKPLIPIAETRVVRYLSARINDKDVKILYSPISTLNPVESITRSLSNMVCNIKTELGVFSFSYDNGGKIPQDLYSICHLEYLEYKGKH